MDTGTMAESKSQISNLLLGYFQQQMELYGDGFILSREEFDIIKRVFQGKSRREESVEQGVAVRTEEMTGVGKGSLMEFFEQIKDCQKCPLGRRRTNFVFGVGNPQADLLLVGEAPGADEDRMGEPFVGRAGQLLNRILLSIHFKREEVFIANILKCRPPGNRDPFPEEVAQCEPYLHQQIKLIQPRVILALGRVAGQTLLKSTTPLNLLRGRLHFYQGIPMVVTFHPAALLRNPQWKYPTWDDVRYLRRVYDAITAGNDPREV